MVLDALCFPTPGFVAARDLSCPGFHLWGCRSTDDPMLWGFLACSNQKMKLQISALATHPHHRRQGVARALMCNAIARAQLSSLSSILLEVHCKNEGAISLYKQLSFTIQNRIPAYYGPGQDAFLMELPLRTSTKSKLIRKPRR